jgi:DNA replication protein DnaC
MSNISQLISLSKSLKLSGLADTLEMRLLEAQGNQLSLSELLLMLFTDEIDRRKNRKLERLMRKAKLKANQTLESFDFSFNHSINASLIRELATLRFLEKGENIFLIGPTGVGKSHLSSAIAHQACRKYYNVEFYNFNEFFTLLLKADFENKLDRLVKTLIKADLLIIDDFAFRKINQKEAEMLYTIIDAKYLSKSLIITSNRAISDWLNIFPDPIMANQILDRIAHNAHQIVIKGDSYRKKNAVKTIKKNQKLENAIE